MFVPVRGDSMERAHYDTVPCCFNRDAIQISRGDNGRAVGRRVTWIYTGASILTDKFATSRVARFYAQGSPALRGTCTTPCWSC